MYIYNTRKSQYTPRSQRMNCWIMTAQPRIISCVVCALCCTRNELVQFGVFLVPEVTSKKMLTLGLMTLRRGRIRLEGWSKGEAFRIAKDKESKLAMIRPQELGWDKCFEVFLDWCFSHFGSKSSEYIFLTYIYCMKDGMKFMTFIRCRDL